LFINAGFLMESWYSFGAVMRFNFHGHVTSSRRRTPPLIQRRPTNPNAGIILQNTWRPFPPLISSFLAVTMKIMVFRDATLRSLVPTFRRNLLSQSSVQCTRKWSKTIPGFHLRRLKWSTAYLWQLPKSWYRFEIWNPWNESLNRGTWYTPKSEEWPQYIL
jgi:hypothetical protein